MLGGKEGAKEGWWIGAADQFCNLCGWGVSIFCSYNVLT